MNQDEAKAMKTAQLPQIRKGGRYEIGISWKEGEPNLKTDFDLAYSRLVRGPGPDPGNTQGDKL